MSAIAVGIVVRGHLEGARDTVLSLSARTHRPFELTLLTDGCDAAGLRELAAVSPSHTDSAVGNAACFNRLVAEKSADLYLLLEAGARVSEGWLDYLLAALERYPKCGLVGPSTNRAGNPQCVFPTTQHSSEEIDRLGVVCAQRFGKSCRSLLPLHSLSDFCYLVRRDVVEAIGKAEESYGLAPFWEMDYNVRAARAGFQGLWACGAYVHRAPLSEDEARVANQRAATGRRIYQQRLCGLHLRGLKEDFRSSCRGDACANFAPAALIAIRTPLAAPAAPRVSEMSSAQPPAPTLPAPPEPAPSLHLLPAQASAGAALPTELRNFRDYHRGATILVCGCGVSLNTLVDPKRFLTIGVNDVGRLFDPDYLVVVNPRKQFRGDRFQYVERSRARVIFTQLDLGLQHPHVVRFKLGKRGGANFSDPNSLDYTSNSPYIALCLAVHMGARRIGIIGVDFTKDHFFGQTGTHALESQLRQIDDEYKRLYKECLQRGVQVVNLSSQSRLTAFPKLSLDEFEQPNAVTGRRIVSYSTMPVAGVPAILARCIAAESENACRTIWARDGYENGVTFQGDVQWEQAPGEAEDLLRSADMVIVHNGKIDPMHRSLLAGKPVVTMAHNYMWNVDTGLVQQGFPGVVVAQYQATLPEFKRWLPVPNPVPLWEEAYAPAAKPSQLTICYTPSGKHESYPAGHALYWHGKGYDSTMRVLDQMAQRFSVKLEVVGSRQVSHAEALAMKQRAHIVIDECVTGSYHRNSLEGLALGCVVVNGLGRVPSIAEVFRRAAGGVTELPFVFASLQNLESVLTSLIEQGAEALATQGARNRAWMEQHWSFRRQWKQLWEPLIAPVLPGTRREPCLAPRHNVASHGADTMSFEIVSKELKQGLSVVVCHGGRDRLPHLATSLADLRQCEGIDEVVVVEMGAVPVAESIARKWADKYVFIRNHEVFERARSLNTGTALATCDLVFWKDNDLLVPSGFISKAVSEMRNRQLDYLLPHSRIHYLSACDSEKVRQGMRNPADCQPVRVFRPVRENCGAAGMVRRSFVLEHGGMSEEFRGWGGEDDAWWYKAQLLGKAAITQRQDQPLYHLFHPQSGANGDNTQIASNPHYSRNVAILGQMRSVRERRTFSQKFPPPTLLACSWQETQLLFLADASLQGLSGPIGETAQVLDRMFGIKTEVQWVAREAFDAKTLSASQVDGMVIVGMALAEQILSDPALEHLLPKTILSDSGEKVPETLSPKLHRFRALVGSSLAPLQKEAHCRAWPGATVGSATPFSMAIALLQPFSLLAGATGDVAAEVHTCNGPEKQAAASPHKLPVWMYWEGECPEWIKRCQETVFAHAGDVRLLTPQSFEQLHDRDCDIDLTRLHVAHRADYVRAFLLARFGGLWIDSDCLVMKPLDVIFETLASHDFVVHRERTGYFSNGFMASQPEGKIISAMYRRICESLRSRQPLGWISLGGEPLTDVLRAATSPWHELECSRIQPICWSNPAAFFTVNSAAEHERTFDTAALCYMLSNTEVRRFLASHPGADLLAPNTFFRYLLTKAMAPKDPAPEPKLRPAAATGWRQIPFAMDAMAELAPLRVLDLGVGQGYWGMLIRQFCEEANGNGRHDNWNIYLAGLASSHHAPAEHPRFLYDRIVTASSADLAQQFAQPWDLVLLGGDFHNGHRLDNGEILDQALDAADYVLVTDFVANRSDRSADDSPWQLTELMQRDPVRFAVYPSGNHRKDVAFLFSRRDPKSIRTAAPLESLFQRQAEEYARIGEESVSGPGSALASTVEIRRRIPLLLQDLGVSTLLDAPCGDCNWIQHVALRVDEYIGIDLVRDVIARNRQRFGGEQRKFLCLDFTRDVPPRADLILCRDCLVHFSYEHIFRALLNLKRSGSRYLLTTTFESVQENRDIETGGWRPLNFRRPPFDFPEPLRLINEKCMENGGRYSDKSLGLWELASLP